MSVQLSSDVSVREWWYMLFGKSLAINLFRHLGLRLWLCFDIRDMNNNKRNALLWQTTLHNHSNSKLNHNCKYLGEFTQKIAITVSDQFQYHTVQQLFVWFCGITSRSNHKKSCSSSSCCSTALGEWYWNQTLYFRYIFFFSNILKVEN